MLSRKPPFQPPSLFVLQPFEQFISMRTSSTMIIALTLIVQTACSVGQNSGNILTPEQVQQQLDKGGVALLDVRTPEEWSEGIIEGAVMKNFYDDDFRAYLSLMDKAHPVIVTCKSGGRSAKTVQMMKAVGFYELYDMGAGMDGWNEENRRTVKPE